MMRGLGATGTSRFTWFQYDATKGGNRGARSLDPHLASAVPRYRVVVLVQRFFLLDADRLCTNGLRWLGEVFPQTFVALTVHLATNRLPHLHQGPSKVERVNDIARVITMRPIKTCGESIQRLTQIPIQRQTL
jgi:hypothetical protein